MKKILFVLVSFVSVLCFSCSKTPAQIAEDHKNDSIKKEQIAKEKWQKDSLYYTPSIIKLLSKLAIGSPMVVKNMTCVDDSLKIVTTSFKDASIIGNINCTLPSDLSRVLDYISNYANKNDTFDSGLWEETTLKDPKSDKKIKCLERKIYINKNLIFCTYFPSLNILTMFEFIGWDDYKVINCEPTTDVIINIKNHLK